MIEVKGIEGVTSAHVPMNTPEQLELAWKPFVLKVGRYLPGQGALDWELTKINMLLDERLE